MKNKNISTIEEELNILRKSVNKAENIIGRNKLNTPEIKKILDILENFLIKKKLLIYGGTAINNILPKNEQFYNRETTLPDYDFFSKNAMDDAKELCDLYYTNGFIDIEAKSGQHIGTYKVYVNFLSIADITNMDKRLFENLKKESIIINKLHYVPANFLRMSIYNELSRPQGDVSRWEKVFKRLLLLNKYYPINDKKLNCNSIILNNMHKSIIKNKNVNNMTSLISNKKKYIYNIFTDILTHQDIVFFGGYSDMFYMKYLPPFKKINYQTYTFDVLSNDPNKLIDNIRDILKKYDDIPKLKVTDKTNLSEIIPLHYKVEIANYYILNIYETNYCYSYNVVKIDKYTTVKIASIETKLFFYLAFIYINDKNYDPERISCLAMFLFLIQDHNKLKERGLLKRFSTSCYGSEKSLENIREIKSNKYKELKNDKSNPEYIKWFFKYIPSDSNSAIKNKPNTYTSNDKIVANEKNKKSKRVHKKIKNTQQNNTKRKRTIKRTTKRKRTTSNKTKKIKLMNIPLISKLIKLF